VKLMNHRILPEDVVTVEDAKEIADRVNSAFAKCSDVSTLAILTDGLVELYRQFGMSPTWTLRALGEAVAAHSGAKVDVMTQQQLDEAKRVARINPIRRRRREH
jgi:3'-phosphoadenosine 5'-phosphosulfate (PAPS) 3'-phosphatase